MYLTYFNITDCVSFVFQSVSEIYLCVCTRGVSDTFDMEQPGFDYLTIVVLFIVL